MSTTEATTTTRPDAPKVSRTPHPRVLRVLDANGATIDVVAGDLCGECGGTGRGAVDSCDLCLGRGYEPVEYTVVAPCRLLLADGCEGRTCACHGDGWQEIHLLAWELDEKPVGVGTAAQRAEAAALMAAIKAEETKDAADAAA